MAKKKKKINKIAEKVAWLLILFLGYASRLSVKNERYLKWAKKSGKPIIILVWHGKMLMPVFIHRNQKIVAMVSEHGDGEIIAQSILRLGYKTVRGSSKRGGSKAFREMLRELKKGAICTILPDGPVGPRFQVKMGAVALAQRSGAILVPLTFSTSRPIRMNSWDKFTIWRPFARVCAMYGKPISIPKKLAENELEEQRLLVEKSMINLQEQADDIFRK